MRVADPKAKVEDTLRELAELHERQGQLHEKLRKRLDDTLRELAKLHERQGQLHEKLRKRLDPVLASVSPPAVRLDSNAWADALRDAARRDLAAAKTLAASMDEHAGAVAMLLQMVFEKLAKAYLARTEWNAFVKHRRSHAAAYLFTQALKRNRERLPKVGARSRDVLPWVEELTRAHPAIAKNGPHLEYPWEQGGRVCSPSRDLPIVHELRDPQSGAAPHLLKFAAYFIDNFDEVFR
jgi:DNA repair exonuclease SbcCD ATPase subunit